MSTPPNIHCNGLPLHMKWNLSSIPWAARASVTWPFLFLALFCTCAPQLALCSYGSDILVFFLLLEQVLFSDLSGMLLSRCFHAWLNIWVSSQISISERCHPLSSKSTQSSSYSQYDYPQFFSHSTYNFMCSFILFLLSPLCTKLYLVPAVSPAHECLACHSRCSHMLSGEWMISWQFLVHSSVSPMGQCVYWGRDFALLMSISSALGVTLLHSCHVAELKCACERRRAYLNSYKG